MTKLFHFSDDPEIAVFEPRPVLIPSVRPAGMDWLNGPLVWAIDEEHEYLYLFPRECPRILVWGRVDSSEADRRDWLGDRRIVAFIEQGWLDRVQRAQLYRYELDQAGFESLEDAGMWVSRQRVVVRERRIITDPMGAMEKHGVELRAVASLAPMKAIWQTSLHASGIRLRNAKSWPVG